MADAKTYLPDELSQKIPQKLLSFMFRTQMDNDEKVLALFGGSGLLGSVSCIAATEGILFYFNNTSMVAKDATILYSDIVDIELNKFIYLSIKDGNKIKVDIKASTQEMQRMYEFINSYKEKGTEYIAQRLNDKNYAWKIDVIHQNKNLKNAEIDHQLARDVASTHNDFSESKAKIHEKYEDNRMKIHENQIEIHEKYEAKINENNLSKTILHYKLTYCSGLNEEIPSALSKIMVNAAEQNLIIEPHGFQTFKIPFTAIKGAYVKTDVEIPKDDVTNEYDYYLHIQCEQNGSNTEIVFSNRQKQNCTVDPIDQLNYALNNIGKKIDGFNERNAHYDQRAQQLVEERKELLAKRDSQIAQIKQTFSGNSDNAVSSSNINTADELRKFKSLLDDGIITQEEFDAKKKQLLNL